MIRLRTALIFSTIAQQSNLLISFVSIAVVARLLTPAEIGVFAVASSLMMLAIEIRSFGVGQYLVREKEITEEKQRTAFGMMLIISWSLATIVILSAPFVATFYRAPELQKIFWIMSGTFIIAPFSTVPFAMLLRDMKFDQILRIKVASGIARAAGSIGLVMLGWSYYGLAAGVLLGAVVELIAITLIDRRRSLMLPSFTLWREVLGFGMTTSISGVLQRFAQSMPDLVLGRTASMADVGLFSRGLGMILFINRLISLAIHPVLLPHLAGIRRRDGNVGDEYLKCSVLHAAVSLSAFAVAAVLALPLIRLFFGNQWDAAAPIASVLALWAMLQTVHGFLPNALLALDRERVVLWKEVLVFLVRLGLIISATSHGLLAVAWAMCLSGVFEIVLCSLLASRYLGIECGRAAKAFLSNVILAGCSWIIATFALNQAVKITSSELIQVVITVLAVLIGWLITLRLLKHDLWTIGIELLSDTFSFMKRTTDTGKT